MDHCAQLLDRTVYLFQPLITLVILAAWCVGAFAAIRARKRKPALRWWLVSVAAGLVFVGLVTGEGTVVNYIRQAALRDILPRLSCAIESVEVNGSLFSKPDALLYALRGMHETIGHHSHPTTRYHVLIQTSCGPLALELGRDSDDSNEYWVFYPGLHSTQVNAVGHSFTDVLDGH